MADPALDPHSVSRSVLANGLTLLVRRDTSAPVVAIVTYVKAGYFDETDDVVGISHALEHMYFKGTPTRGVGEIARQTKAAGGYLNAATIYDHTVYYTVLPSSGWKTGLEVQFDAYANSQIDGDELRRELEVIIQEAKRKADNPSAVTSETLFELLHDKHRMRRWRIGREPGLRALDRDAMLRFYRNFYHPGNTVLSIVGDVDVAEVSDAVRASYGALESGTPVHSPGPSEDSLNGFRYRELAGDVGQTQIALGWRTCPALDPVSPGLDMLGMILAGGRASRLYRGVRERQLVSGISAYNYTPTSLGVFLVHAEAPPERAAEAVREIWAQLRNIQELGVDDGELERVKRQYEARWVRRLEDMEGQANYLAEWEALGGWEKGDEYLERAMAVTSADVSALARKYLDPDHAGIVIYRPTDAQVVAESPEAMRAMLDGSTAADALEELPAVPSGVPAKARLRIEREESGVRVYRTESGGPLLAKRKSGSLVHAAIYAVGGAREEPARLAGLTHMLVRLALKGTARRSAVQIAEASEGIGASIGGNAGSESFGWSVSVPSKSAAGAIELLADVAQFPIIPAAALETERALALAGLVAQRDDMYRYPMRLATQAAFAGHPYAQAVGGEETTLPEITAEDLRGWHRDRFLHGPVVLAIVGDADVDELAGLMASYFGELRGGEAASLADATWPAGVIQRSEQREKAQTALALLFPAPRRTDPARFAAEMIAGVASGLGGRFFDELRDKQSLGYTVQAHSSARALGGTFASYIATSPEKEEIARQGLLAEFDKLRNESVTAAELVQAQTYAVGTHAIRQQSGGAVLGEMIDAFLFGALDELAGYEHAIRSVTAREMQHVAQQYFHKDRRVEGIIRGVGATV